MAREPDLAEPSPGAEAIPDIATGRPSGRAISVARELVERVRDNLGDPWRILLGCLLFGFSDALSLRLQTLGISSYLVLAVPYLVALAALFALSYRARPKIIRETLESMNRVLFVKSVPETQGK